jgi:hypothetical protein
MKDAIANGDIEMVGTGIEVREMAEVALQRWPLVTIEEAVARDAASILPAGLRTRKFTVRLPRYQIGALEVLAEDGNEPVEAMLMRSSRSWRICITSGSRASFPAWRGDGVTGRQRWLA